MDYTHEWALRNVSAAMNVGELPRVMSASEFDLLVRAVKFAKEFNGDYEPPGNIEYVRGQAELIVDLVDALNMADHRDAIMEMIAPGSVEAHYGQG